ncbi:MAG: hypothetical protein ACI9G1_001123, partial [Pirellulaceae bacterium]
MTAAIDRKSANRFSVFSRVQNRIDGYSVNNHSTMFIPYM